MQGKGQQYVLVPTKMSLNPRWSKTYINACSDFFLIDFFDHIDFNLNHILDCTKFSYNSKLNFSGETHVESLPLVEDIKPFFLISTSYDRLILQLP